MYKSSSTSSALQLCKESCSPLKVTSEQASFVFRNNDNFYGVRSASRPTPNLEDQGTPLVWVITFDLSGKGDPSSSYPIAGIALWVI
jgi:hypothetical protein